MNWIRQEDDQEEWDADHPDPIAGAEGFQLHNVKEEFAQLGGLETPLHEMDPDPASFLEGLLSTELEQGSVGGDKANGNSEDSGLWQEQFVLHVKTEEGASHEKKLNVRLVGVDSVDNSPETTVDVHELQNSQLFSDETEESPHGVEQEVVGGGNEIVSAQQEEIGTKVDVVDEIEQEDDLGTFDVLGSEVHDEEISPDRGIISVDDPQLKISPGFVDVLGSEVHDEEISSDRGIISVDDPQPKISPGFIDVLGSEVHDEEISSDMGIISVDDPQPKISPGFVDVLGSEVHDEEISSDRGIISVDDPQPKISPGFIDVLGSEVHDEEISSDMGIISVDDPQPKISPGFIDVLGSEVHDEEISSDRGIISVDDPQPKISPGFIDVLGSEVHDEEISSDLGIISVDDPQPKISPGFISDMILDGCLSVEGLASKGFVFMSDDESDSDEDSDDSSEDEEDEESGEVSSIADSDEGHAMEIKSKAKTARKGKQDTEDADEAGPPRTKHELDVLPPVPNVTAVLKPHHKTMSVGHICSVLDLKVIVESSGNERILNESSILWLTEARVPLGIVDEVFGPVKNPFYVVRFNTLAEIPEDAKTGADVSYVSEFSEFVLKDNPSLYKKAVDASGLDDEELGSDEDLEFSDDEKEAAARMREKSKRGLDNRQERQGQDSKFANGQHSKEQRTERGRGRGRNRGRGPATEFAVDSAADFVAGMDLQASPWRSTGSGSNQQNGRRWNRGRQSSPRISGHQEPHTRGSRAGPSEGQRSSPQHQRSPQRSDGLYFAEQANRQMFAEQTNRQMLAQQANRQMLAQQANRQMLAESAKRQLLAQQANQAAGSPFNAGARPVHSQGQGVLRQQPTTGFQAFAYSQVPGYDARQGNVYSVPGPFIQNSVIFSNPNLPPNPFFNNQRQGQVNIIQSQGYGNVVNAGQVNFGVPVHRSIGDAHAGIHPSLLGNGAVALDHRNQSVPQNSQNQGPQWHGPNKYYK